MSLFQHSVLNKYLKEANQTEIKSAYEKLITYFHNPVIQQNIRESKEEQFQGNFLKNTSIFILSLNLYLEYSNKKATLFKTALNVFTTE